MKCPLYSFPGSIRTCWQLFPHESCQEIGSEISENGETQDMNVKVNQIKVYIL